MCNNDVNINNTYMINKDPPTTVPPSDMEVEKTKTKTKTLHYTTLVGVGLWL
jgi:hypothetical protein